MSSRTTPQDEKIDRNRGRAACRTRMGHGAFGIAMAAVSFAAFGCGLQAGEDAGPQAAPPPSEDGGQGPLDPAAPRSEDGGPGSLDAGTDCGANANMCAGHCAANSPTACGSACRVCTAPANGTAACERASCDFTCNSGYERVGATCERIRPWTPQTSSSHAFLEAIWGSGPSDVYAVGVGNTIVHSDDGVMWTAQPHPSPSLGTAFFGVWGSGRDDVYVVGSPSSSPGTGIILHSTGGGTWTPQTNPSTAQELRGIWGSGSGDVYAVGSGGTILHSSGGGTWISEASGTTQNLLAIWGSGSGDVYAVGGGGTILHSTGGGLWTSEVTGTTDPLGGVWGSGSGDVYAVGGSHPIILHSIGGGTWTTQAVDPTANVSPVTIWGAGSGDVYAVGVNGVLHSTGGGTWTQPLSTTFSLYGIWGSGSDDVYAAGSDGRLLRRH